MKNRPEVSSLDLAVLTGINGEPHTFTTLEGDVTLRYDEEQEFYCIDAKPQHKVGNVAAVLTQAEWWGLEPLDEDEMPSEVLADGTVRIHLAKIGGGL